MPATPIVHDPVAEARTAYEEAQEHLSAYIETQRLLDRDLDHTVIGQLFSESEAALLAYFEAMRRVA